jgi:hypothetical protein
MFVTCINNSCKIQWTISGMCTHNSTSVLFLLCQQNMTNLHVLFFTQYMVQFQNVYFGHLHVGRLCCMYNLHNWQPSNWFEQLTLILWKYTSYILHSWAVVLLHFLSFSFAIKFIWLISLTEDKFSNSAVYFFRMFAYRWRSSA